MSERSRAGTHAPEPIAAARAALLAWVDEAGATGRIFLQAHLSAAGSGRYRVRHVDDRHRADAELERVTDPFAAREIAQTTAQDEHRPLKTAPNLRRGWLLDELDGRGLWIALDYLYPACAAHWNAAREGTLRATAWADTAGRQSGIYSAVGLLTDGALRDTVRACCADAVCLRRVAWGARPGESALTADLADASTGDAVVPCPEACSMFISFARQVLQLERQPREAVPGLGRLSAEEREQIRAVVAAAAEGTLDTVREGDFAEPTNQRRIRYLAARLEKLQAEG